MTVFSLPWLDLAVLLPVGGALFILLCRDRGDVSRWSLAITGAAFVCSFLAWLGFHLGWSGETELFWTLLPDGRGGAMLGLDELSAPLVPVVALLHFLTALTTTRTKERRFSFPWLLVGDSLRLATFACLDPWSLVGLLVAGPLPAYFEIRHRGRPSRAYALHMLLFAALLLGGWSLARLDTGHAAWWAALPLLLAVMVRAGAVPVHCWVLDLFENASFGTALLVFTPLTAVYAAVRLVLPVAPDWVLTGIAAVSLLTALYAAGMAVVQVDVRRFFAYLCLSHASIVLVGLELHTETSLTGALCLWFSLMLSLTGFGLTLRSLEARFGRLALDRYRGLYDQSPTLAVCFLLTGLACVGFPGTLGFVSGEMLVDGAVHRNLLVGLGVVLAGAINGIAVVKAYFLLFTGSRHLATVSLEITPRERFAVLTLSVLILGGGLLPQPGVQSRYRAAGPIIQTRQIRHLDPMPREGNGVGAAPTDTILGRR